MKTTNKQLPALTAEHWNNVTQENKMNFYQCTTHFFETNDMLKVVQSLENAKSENKQMQIDIDKSAAGLKSLWIRYNMHVRDMDVLADKAKHWLKPVQQLRDYTAAEVTALESLTKTIDELGKADETSKLYSVVGMVLSLTGDDYLDKVNSILRENFKGYYFDKPAA